MVCSSSAPPAEDALHSVFPCMAAQLHVAWLRGVGTAARIGAGGQAAAQAERRSAVHAGKAWCTVAVLLPGPKNTMELCLMLRGGGRGRRVATSRPFRSGGCLPT